MNFASIHVILPIFQRFANSAICVYCPPSSNTSIARLHAARWLS